MTYPTDTAYEAFKLLRELKPDTTPMAYIEFTEDEKAALRHDYENIKFQHTMDKIEKLLTEIDSLLKVIKPV